MPSATFKASFRVTWADTDAAQVVHYSNYFRFFERAEEEFYRHLGFNFTDLHARGLWFPRVEAFCRFRQPARYDDLIEVEIAVGELKEKSVRFEFNVFNKDTAELLATATQWPWRRTNTRERPQRFLTISWPSSGLSASRSIEEWKEL